jgi:hypothetical protein
MRILFVMNKRVYSRAKVDAVARTIQMTAVVIPRPLRFGGFSKTGVTPSGGREDGPFMILSSMVGGIDLLVFPIILAS